MVSDVCPCFGDWRLGQARSALTVIRNFLFSILTPRGVRLKGEIELPFLLRITFANVIPRCKYSLIKVPTLASSLPVLLTASRRPCAGRGAEVGPYRVWLALSLSIL